MSGLASLKIQVSHNQFKIFSIVTQAERESGNHKNRDRIRQFYWETTVRAGEVQAG